MTEKNKGIIARYRPDGWDILVEGLVEECVKAGDIEIDDNNRAQIENFIRYCIEKGADAMLKGLRSYGVDAIVRDQKILLVLSKIVIPRRPQFRDAGMTYRDKRNYKGPGRVCFIPDDKEIIKISRDIPRVL